MPLTLQEFAFVGGDLKKSQESLSGNLETQFYGQKRVYRVVLEPVLDSESEALREFIDSTADGQLFTLDPYGFPDQPVRPLTVVREDQGASENIRLRDGGDAWVQFEFEVRVQ